MGQGVFDGVGVLFGVGAGVWDGVFVIARMADGPTVAAFIMVADGEMVSVGCIEVGEIDGIVSVPVDNARGDGGTAVGFGGASFSRPGTQADKIQDMTKTRKGQLLVHGC